MSNNKKFKSALGTTIRVTLPNGGVALVGNTWEELPPQYHAGAYAQGAISDDMIAAEVGRMLSAEESKVGKTLTAVEKKKNDMRSTILTWIEDNEMDHFSAPPKGGQLKPKVADLSKAVGQRCFKEDRDEVWYKLLEEEGIEPPVK